MSNINEISNLIKSTVPETRHGSGVEQPSKADKISFSDTIKDFITAVNQSQKTAGGKVADIVEGKSENLPEAMVRMEESKLNFQLLLEIRTRLLDSYKEIQRMQV